MLTGKQVRVRYARDRIIPYYLDPDDENWRLLAEQLLELYRAQDGHTRGELEDDIAETFGDEANTLVHQGLAKLLEDRCDFEVVAGHPPDALRAAVFRAAGEHRKAPTLLGVCADPHDALAPFDRDAVLRQVAADLGLRPEQVEHGMFADLKSAQRLVKFHDVSAEHLLQRY